MTAIKRGFPLAIAIAFGLLTLLGLLFVPSLSHLILGWAGFLMAVALLLGILNLLTVHLDRVVNGRNLYSGVLVLSMLTIFALALTDAQGITENSVTTAFNWIQAPLEAALASLLVFFLLFAGFQMFKRQRNIWAVLFLLTAILALASQALVATTLLPDTIRTIFAQIQNIIDNIIVTAGMRGLLIGIALGSITLSLRLLIGLDQPYNK